MKRTLPCLLLTLFAGACASGPRPVYERGWIGGELLPVVDADDWRAPHSPDAAWSPVSGLPQGVIADGAVLVTGLADDAPLARAGVRPGDLVVACDGVAVTDPLAFREHVEALTPGGVARLRVWQGGAVREVDVVVGRERFERIGTLGLGIGFPFWSPTFDIWPFDDGIDVLGIVVLKSDCRRHESAGPRGDYLRAVHGDDTPVTPLQETFTFRVLPITVARGVRVLGECAD